MKILKEIAVMTYEHDWQKEDLEDIAALIGITALFLGFFPLFGLALKALGFGG